MLHNTAWKRLVDCRQDSATVKEELDIGLTVLQPPDKHYMLRPCKPEPADTTLIVESMEMLHRPQSSHHSVGEKYEPPCELSSENTTANKEKTAKRERKYVHQVNCASNLSQTGDVCSEHSRAHINVRSYTCDNCTKCFKQRSNLYNHMIFMHVNKRPFICDVCSTRFKFKCQLTKHEKIHADNRLYSCDICSNSFNQSNCLNGHKKIHADHRPYSCDLCSKRFTRKEHLNEHKQIHTGERLYNCDIGSKSFILKSNLTKHKKVHIKNRLVLLNNTI